MNRVTIRRVDVVRTANVVAVLYAVLVLVVLLVFFLPFTLLVGVAGSSRGDTGAGALIGASVAGTLVVAVVGVVFYGLLGWITTAIIVALYNFVAGRIGGFRMQVDLEGPYPGGPAYGYPAPGSPAYPAAGPGSPSWPVPGSPGAPMPPPPGWGQPGS